MCPDAWAAALTAHPDQAFAHYVCNAFPFRYQIGIVPTTASNNASPTSGSSLSPERTLNRRMLGPFHSFQYQQLWGYPKGT